MPGDVRGEALRYLREHNVMTLATDGPGGLWAAAVFYASEGFRLTFLSAPHTRHATNLHAQPRVAATIQEDTRSWPDIQGIQLEGVAEALSGDAERHAMAVFGAKFPFFETANSASGELADALAGVRWYRLTPDRLYFIDNTRGLGQRDEVPLPPP